MKYTSYCIAVMAALFMAFNVTSCSNKQKKLAKLIEQQKVINAYFYNARHATTNLNQEEHTYWIREAEKQFIKMYGHSVHQKPK